MYILLENCIFQSTEKILYYTDLLQTEDERLGTLNLIYLPSLTHSLLDDVAIIVVILEQRKIQ